MCDAHRAAIATGPLSAAAALTSNLSKDIFLSMRRSATIRLTDPRALRAYAHPLRLALIGALRGRGPLTATTAANLLGVSPASCSFHLRQLAKYGLVEETGDGTGRERPWRATALYTRLPKVAATPEHAEASRQVYRVLAERYFHKVLHWLATRTAEPRRWQHAAHFGDEWLYLTAEELADLRHRINGILRPYRVRTIQPKRRPLGARPVTFLHLAFPEDEIGGDAATGRAVRRRTRHRQ